MKFAHLFIIFLRYRVAIMLFLFFALGAVNHGGLGSYDSKYFFAIVSLFTSYIAATTINDIADLPIDRINHPKNAGRPLVVGNASVNDAWLVHVASVIITFFLGIILGGTSLLIIIASLISNYLYSAPPFRISYRTHFATLLLSVAYVGFPYLLGVSLTGSSISFQTDGLLICSLLFLFHGRIILKDFRDRKGDKKFGKPTFLLVYGKKATCLISVGSIFIGQVLMFIFLNTYSLFIALLLQLFFVFIYLSGYYLWKIHDAHMEQVEIGIGAKMGNGLLITLLGILLLHNSRYDQQTLMNFAFLVTAFYVGNGIYLFKNKKDVLLGYKG